jgi:hypothetical protein
MGYKKKPTYYYYYYYYYVWPSGCLIAPYCGKLMRDQVFTPCTPEAESPAAAINSAPNPAGNDGANGGSSISA